MSLFEWKPVFSVKIQSIDDQHQRLIGYMNQFYENQEMGEMANAKVSLTSLVASTRSHFAAEEAMMAKYDYPDLVDHKVQHKQLLKTVEGLVQRFQGNPNAENADDLAIYLRIWLTTHILGKDQKYGPYLIAKGAK